MARVLFFYDASDHYGNGEIESKTKTSNRMPNQNRFSVAYKKITGN